MMASQLAATLNCETAVVVVEPVNDFSPPMAGLGIIWQPSFLIGADLSAGRLIPLLPGYRLPDIDILFVYPSRRHLSAKVRVMIDFLADAFKDISPWDVNA